MMKKKRQNKHKPIAVVFCLLISMTFLLSSCGFIVIPDKDGQTTDAGTAGTSGTTNGGSHADPDDTDVLYAAAEAYLAALGSFDMGGDYLVIASVNDEATAPLANANAMDAYRQKRNALIEQKFNCKLMVLDYDATQLYNDMLYEKENNTGTYIADLYMIPQKYIGMFSAAGLLGNIRSLPYVDLTAPYFDADALNATAAGNAVYAAIGDFTYAPEYASGVYFNKTLLSQISEKTLREIYAANDWNWNTLLSLAGACAAQTGKYGAILDTDASVTVSDLVSASSGVHFINAALDITPTISDNTGAANAVIAATKAVTDSGLLQVLPEESEIPAFDSFVAGNSLFYIGSLGNMEKLNGSGLDWGLLPLPKVTREQDAYFSLVNGDMPLLCVSEKSQNANHEGMLIQALFAASYGYLREFYTQYTLGTLAPDNLTAVSVDNITDGLFYDFRMMYASGYPALTGGLDAVLAAGAPIDLFDASNEIKYILTHTFRARTTG